MPAPLHVNTFEALAAASGALELPGRPADAQRICEGAKFHSPTPLLLHEVQVDEDRTATLCGVCRDNLAALRQLLIVDPKLSWQVRREFGNKLRALVSTTGEADG